MDDRSFDSLVKAVALGTSRRRVLKGMLGLGGAALVGSAALEDDADAARRPTPTPKPVKCPGLQTWNGSQCVCPDGAPEKCGPDCCTNGEFPPGSAGYSECCDNACCFGTCTGEELCCPTNTPAGGGPPIAHVCANGECCLAPYVCFNGACVAHAGCESNDDCGACETCNPGSGQCSSLCTRDLPQCCVNGFGEYCAPAGATCCSSASDCTEPCSYCNDVVRYCVDRCDNPDDCCEGANGDDCCASDRCIPGQGCCAEGTSACGENCCDNATERCDGNGNCVCKADYIECDGVCVNAQCCGRDDSNCEALGYDLDCVACSSGVCDTASFDYRNCGTGLNSWCSSGQCLACIPYLSYGCTYDNQCCNGSCLGGRCDTH